MKATILPENIINYLPLLGKIIPTHAQLPILSNILIEAGKEGLVVKATDLEFGVSVTIPSKVEEVGEVAIPGKEFIEAINSLPKDKITLLKEKDEVQVSCRDSHLSFSTIPAAEFPQFYKEKGVRSLSFTRKEFFEIFSSLLFSVSTEDIRPQLSGVFVDVSEKTINFVSTDGYRMSVKKVVKKGVEESVLIPADLIAEVLGLKEDGDIVLFINKKEGQIVFEVGRVVLVGRMIEGSFPDYQKVLPEKADTTISFEREEMLRSVRLGMVFAKDSGNIAHLEVAGNNIKIKTKSQGVGSGETNLECVKEGEDNRIAFNIRYLLDILKNVSEKEILLKLGGPSDPALFEVKEENFIHVIMPIQVD